MLIVLAGGQRLLKKEALAAAARGGFNRQHPRLILAGDREEKLVIEDEGIAGDFNTRPVRALGNIEASELDVLCFAGSKL